MNKYNVKHDLPSWMIHRMINKGIGSAEALASILGLRTSIVEKWARKPQTDEDELATGVRNVFDRLEEIKIALANENQWEILEVIRKFLWEIDDAILSKRLMKKLEEVKGNNKEENKIWFKIFKALFTICCAS